MTDQANQTTEIIDAMKALTTSQQINNATTSLMDVTKNIQPTLQSITAATDAQIKSLTDSTKVLTEAAKVLQEVSTHLTASQLSSPLGTQPTYVSMAATTHKQATPFQMLTTLHSNLDMPNKLLTIS